MRRTSVFASAVLAVLGMCAGCATDVSRTGAGEVRSSPSKSKDTIAGLAEKELSEYVVKCGESFYYLEIWNGREGICNQLAPGKNWKVKITEKALTEADRLNGVEFKAEYACLYDGPARSAMVRQKTAADRWTRFEAGKVIWSEWKDWKNLAFLKFDIALKNGNFTIAPLPGGNGEQRWIPEKLTCADVPGGAGNGK